MTPMYDWGLLVEGDIHAGSVTFQNVSTGIFGLAFRSKLPARQTRAASTYDPKSSRSRYRVEKLRIRGSGHVPVTGNQGRLHLDDAAVRNEHCDKTAVVRSRSSAGFRGKFGRLCIMDTGTPRITVPPKVFDSAAQLIEAGLRTGLALGGGSTELRFGHDLPDGGSGGSKVSGYQKWAIHYTVFDITNRSVVSSNPQEPGTEASRSAIFQKYLAEAESLACCHVGSGAGWKSCQGSQGRFKAVGVLTPTLRYSRRGSFFAFVTLPRLHRQAVQLQRRS